MNRLQHVAFIILGLAFIVPPLAAHDRIKTVVGGGPNGIPGLATNIPGIGQIAADAEGNLYILATNGSGSGVVYKWSHGVVTHIAGDETYQANSDSQPVDSFDGDSGLATKIELNGLNAIAVDNSIPANVYVSDSTFCIVLKIDQKTGMISPVAGSLGTSSTDTGPQCVFYPVGVAVDPRNGDLYVAPNQAPVALIPGPASTGSSKVPDAPAENCSGYPPYNVPGVCLESLALDTSVTPANLYIGVNCRVDEIVGATGMMYTVAGSTSQCGSTDNVLATLGRFNEIQQLSATGNGTTATVRVADGYNGSIRQFTVTSVGGVPHPGLLTTIAGVSGSAKCNPASTLALGTCFHPGGLAADDQGNTYIAETDYGAVERVSPTGTISPTIAWEPGAPFYSNPEVLRNSVAQPALWAPAAVFADPTSSQVYIGGGGGNAVYRWNSVTRRISDFAGNGLAGLKGDGELAAAPGTELASPSGMAKDDSGNLYVADQGNCRIRVVNAATRIITTFAGEAPCGYSGDDGPALYAHFDHPNAVAFDAHGNLFVADTNNCAIRKIDRHTLVVTTIAGGLPSAQCVNNGAFSGDGGPAAKAQLWLPTSLSFDRRGNLYIADSHNAVIREIVAATGIIQTVAGIGGDPGFNGDPGLNGNGLATEAQLNTPTWVRADANSNLFIADTGNNVLRWITPAGQIVTFAGAPPALGDDTFLHRGFEGDGGSAVYALLYSPVAIDQDWLGNFYVADQVNNRIRQISAFPAYGLSAGGLTFATQQVGSTSPAQIIRISAIGPLEIGIVTVSDGFKEIDNCAHSELAAGQACEVHVRFDPKSAGAVTGTLRVYSNALLAGDGSGGYYNGNPDTVTLSGTALK